jgi:hypothetical protein
MTKLSLLLLVALSLANGIASAREVSPHARKAVEAIRQLREIGLSDSAGSASGPPARVPGLLRTLNQELRALIVEYLNDQTRLHTIPTDEDVLDELRAAGWEEISSQKWNAYGEIDDIDFELKDGYDPGLLVVTTQLWIPCGSSDPDAAIYVFQGRGRKWDLVLATESDFNAVGRRQASGMDYRISPPDASGKWFLVVGHVPPSCKRAADVLRYKALRPSSDPDKPTVLVNGREAINQTFDPAFRIEAHEDWFAFTIGKVRKLDDEPGIEILRYGVSGKEARRIPPLALAAEDFLEQWAQTDWVEAKQWSRETGGLFEWHEKLRGVTPGSAEIDAVQRCAGADDGDQVLSIQLNVDQRPNPGFGPETVYVDVDKRNGIFSVEGVRKLVPSGCTERISMKSATERTLPLW